MSSKITSDNMMCTLPEATRCLTAAAALAPVKVSYDEAKSWVDFTPQVQLAPSTLVDVVGSDYGINAVAPLFGCGPSPFVNIGSILESVPGIKINKEQWNKDFPGSFPSVPQHDMRCFGKVHGFRCQKNRREGEITCEEHTQEDELCCKPSDIMKAISDDWEYSMYMLKTFQP